MSELNWKSLGAGSRRRVTGVFVILVCMLAALPGADASDVTGDLREDLITYQGSSVGVFPSTGTAFSGAVGVSGGALTIPIVGAATPFPSTANIAGFVGTVGKVTVNLYGLNHTKPDDLDILLVGPGGQQSILMSDVGGDVDAVSLDLTFDQVIPASHALPDGSVLVNPGTYRPVDYDPGDNFPAGAPPGPYTADLGVFNGIDPNGTWSLYVDDDQGNGSGSLAGWSVTVQVAPWAALPEASQAIDTYIGDVTGDGLTDLIYRVKGPDAGLTTGDVFVRPSTGTGFAEPTLWSYGWGTSYELYFADGTGDGLDDLVARSLPEGDVFVFASTGTAFSSAGPLLWTYGWSSGYDLYFGDVNGDSRDDLVGRYYGPADGLTGDVYVALSTGSAFAFNGRWTYGFSSGYHVYVAEVSGDNMADIVGRLVATGDVYVLPSNGSAFTFNGNFDPWATGLGSNFDLLLKQVDLASGASLVSRNRTTGVVEVRLNAGTEFGAPTTWLTGIYTNFQFPEHKPQSIF
jgi:subtilisin-like proprotein convertase family protein